MNSFQLVGYVRENPTNEIIDNKEYTAFILTNNFGRLNVPIYATDKSAKQFKNYVCVGCEVSVSGHLVTINKFDQSTVYIQMFLVADEIKRINAPKVSFNRNVVIKALLGMTDPDDLLRDLKKKKGIKNDK